MPGSTGKGKKLQPDPQKRIRTIAVNHALDIEEKKRLRNQILDLLVQASELPTETTANAAQPSVDDATLFSQCLRLFQTVDLDDLVTERNVGGRCGYALCANPRRVLHGGGQKIWNGRAGNDFKLLSKESIEKWCSSRCGDRTAFIRAQLSNEPAWLRQSENTVRLLDDLDGGKDINAAITVLATEQAESAELADRLQVLSMERGADKANDVSQTVSVVEKETSPTPARAPVMTGGDRIEGHQVKKRDLHDAGKPRSSRGC